MHSKISLHRAQGFKDVMIGTRRLFGLMLEKQRIDVHPFYGCNGARGTHRGDHVIVTYSKPTPARASRTQKQTAAAADMLAEQHQQGLRSNRPVRANTSSASSSVGQAAYRVTTSMKDVWDYVKSGIGNVVESWTTKKMERGEKKFMDSLANFMSLVHRCLRIRRIIRQL